MTRMRVRTKSHDAISRSRREEAEELLLDEILPIKVKTEAEEDQSGLMKTSPIEEEEFDVFVIVVVGSKSGIL